VRELRHPDDVFEPNSLASLQGRAVTDLHPADGQVRADNWKNLAVGHVSDSIGREGDRVATSVYVNDADMIHAIQEGKRKELSAGYYADTVDEPGVYDGQPYDRRQTNIRYNHVALGPEGWGRAGPECALRIDSAHEGLDILVNVREGTDMAFRIDGKDYEGPDAQKAIDALQADRDAAKGAAAAHEATAKKEKIRADAAEASVGAKVKERVKLLADIRKGNAFYRDAGEEPAAEPDGSADPVAMMTEALSKWNPGLDLKGKDPQFIMGAFQAMMSDVLGEESEEQPEKPIDSNTMPAGNHPPEMELNGGAKPATRIKRRTDNRDPSIEAKDWLRAGKVEHDKDGFPRNDKGEPLDERSANIIQNDKRAMAPLAVTKA